MKYAYVIERAGNRYRAYVPDLPGCIASGDSLEEAERALRIAIRYHVEELRSGGQSVPPPTSSVNYVGAPY